MIYYIFMYVQWMSLRRQHEFLTTRGIRCTMSPDFPSMLHDMIKGIQVYNNIFVFSVTYFLDL